MNTPALYATDPENLLNFIFDRMRHEGLVIRQEPDKALTIAQAAERLNFTPDHIRRLIDDGVLPAVTEAFPLCQVYAAWAGKRGYADFFTFKNLKHVKRD